MSGLQQTNAITKQLTCHSITPQADTALVVEGGGQRGIFTAGVLDTWLANDFNPFSLLIGTSAGAQNLSSYMTRQFGHAKGSILELSQHPEFFNMSRSLRGGHIVDLDWYFNQVSDPDYQLNLNCACSQLQQRKLLFSATKVNGLESQFFEPTADNWLTLLKATSALPFLYKNGVDIAGENYVDGGVAQPIPIQEAYQRGAKKIVVIRTVPSEYNAQSQWLHKLKTWLCNDDRCPRILDIITRHETAYENAVKFIDNPPDDVKIIEIAPSKVLDSRLLGSSDSALKSDYQLGIKAGLSFLEKHQDNLLITENI